MIIVLNKNITNDQKSHIRNTLLDKGCFVRETEDAGQNLIGALGKSNLDVAFLTSLPGVEAVTPIPTPFKLASRQWHSADTLVPIGNVLVGGERIVIIAGPCAVESRDQALTIAREVKRYGALVFRGGAFKPTDIPLFVSGAGRRRP